MRKCVAEAPGRVWRKILMARREVLPRHDGKEPEGHQLLYEGIMYEGLRRRVREMDVLQLLHFGGEEAEMRGKALERERHFGVEVEARGVLAPECDQVPTKSEIVADKHAHADGHVNGELFVVGRAHP